jgi:hypothetical protein
MAVSVVPTPSTSITPSPIGSAGALSYSFKGTNGYKNIGAIATGVYYTVAPQPGLQLGTTASWVNKIGGRTPQVAVLYSPSLATKIKLYATQYVPASSSQTSSPLTMGTNAISITASASDWILFTHNNDSYSGAIGSNTIGQYNGIQVGFGTSSPTDVYGSWQTMPATDQYNAVGYNGTNTWVAVSATNTSATSTDGITWTARTPGVASVTYYDLKWLNNLFLLGGSSGNLYTSPDAITWTARTSGFGTSTIYDFAYGSSVYVAVGTGGVVNSSTDAITWSARSGGFGSSTVWGVSYGGGKFVAVGGTATTGKIASSTDGITWTNPTSPFSSTTVNISRVAYNSVLGQWICVAVETDATNSYASLSASTDGVTWATKRQQTSVAVSTTSIQPQNFAIIIFSSGYTLVYHPGDGGNYGPYNFGYYPYSYISGGAMRALDEQGLINSINNSNAQQGLSGRCVAVDLTNNWVLWGKYQQGSTNGYLDFYRSLGYYFNLYASA